MPVPSMVMGMACTSSICWPTRMRQAIITTTASTLPIKASPAVLFSLTSIRMCVNFSSTMRYIGWGEFHVDGFRYDLASEIENHGGSRFCQDLTGTVRFVQPSAPQIAEYWNNDRKRAVIAPPDGLGFDLAWHDLLREKLRGIIGDASAGGSGPLDVQGLAGVLAFRPTQFPNFFKAVQYLESHDAVHVGSKLRVPALADPSDHRSFFCTSRTRVATGILLTAPSVPMLFMGEEFLEDKQW